MIELRNLCKAYRTDRGWNQVLDDVSIVFPSRTNIGVLGLNGAGKSTLLRLIGGIEPPDAGRIVRDVRVSWPIGFGGGFQGNLTGRENTRFVARIYGADIHETERYVADFSELGPYFDMPVKTYSSGMRGRLAFAVSMAMQFDCYLVDEVTAVGDRRFKQKYKEEFRRLRDHGNLIMVSHQPGTIEEFCEMAAVLHDGELVLYGSVDEGMKAYEVIAPESRRLRKRPRLGRKRGH
jgi:capsular polysaccharide transport system ATP-binding protein